MRLASSSRHLGSRVVGGGWWSVGIIPSRWLGRQVAGADLIELNALGLDEEPLAPSASNHLPVACNP